MPQLITLRHQLLSKKHRQLVIISGSQSWQKQHLTGLYENDKNVFWVGTHPGSEQVKSGDTFAYADSHYQFIEAKRLPYYLGQEIDGAVIDVKHGLSADTLGILAGMIKAGGLLILLTPAIDEWQSLVNPENSRFLNTPLTIDEAKTGFTHHLIQTWQQSDVIWVEQNDSNTQAMTPLSETPKTDFLVAESFVQTADQQQAISSIHTVAFGHRKRPLVITADRGRGKSSVLGMAAVECLIQGKQHIAITASRLDQTLAAYKHAIQTLESIASQDSNVHIQTNKPGLVEFIYHNETKRIQFIAPDALILNPTSADVLLVDEAAHLPTPVLIELLIRHHRLVFATTLHGYEGSGRGFELRFKKQLTLHTPDWKACTLSQPIRWADHDPLEHAINQALLLDANMAEFDELNQPLIEKIHAENLTYQLIDSQQLLDNLDLMQSLFGLLVQAHYQTSPNDLQQLLNAPNIKILAALLPDQRQPKVLGALLCIEEGKISPGIKRAHGHLVPQLLTKHYAQNDFLMLSTLRIMRIAVHPQYQRSGIGKQLIKQIEQLGITNRIDYISSSFGASEELLPFWFNQYFWPLHVGAKRDKASGSHNLVVAKPLTAMARQALSLIQTRFQEQFPHLLLESLPYFPPTQVWPIIQTFRFKKRQVGYEKALANYQNDTRPYESVSNKLWEWSLQSAIKVVQSSPTTQAIWCDKILKKQSWQDVAHQYHLAGRKGVEEKLKLAIEDWLKTTPSKPLGR